jgi:hypothetical protein
MESRLDSWSVGPFLIVISETHITIYHVAMLQEQETKKSNRIWGCHNHDYQEYYLLGCNAIYSSRSSLPILYEYRDAAL